MDIPPYTQIQMNSIDYMIINRTRKLQDVIKTWNLMTPIPQNEINFQPHFLTAHRKLEETVKLTMEYAWYHQYRLVNDIVTHMSGLQFTYPYQEPAH